MSELRFPASDRPVIQLGVARQLFGWFILIGFVTVVWHLLTAGRRETRVVQPLQTA